MYSTPKYNKLKKDLDEKEKSFSFLLGFVFVLFLFGVMLLAFGLGQYRAVTKEHQNKNAQSSNSGQTHFH